jgi:RNA polymerase sigma factor (sigma-70 family)
MDGNSVTLWLKHLKAGDPTAAQRIWERYCKELIKIARQRLAGVRRAADEHDVVQDAFDAFFRAAQTGRFTVLHDRDDLWKLLVRITENQAFDQRRREQRAKRGGGAVRGDSAFLGGDGSTPSGFNQLAGHEPSPDFALMVADELRHLLGLLDSPHLQELVILKMAGHTQREIAERWGCAHYSISRKLRLVRALWTEACAL